MNALQYIVVILATVAVIGTPFMLAKAVRRKQKYRVFEIPLAALMLTYVALDTAFPAVVASAPRPVHWFGVTAVSLWMASFFGISALGIFRRFFVSRKASPIERC